MYNVKKGVTLPKYFQKGDSIIVLSEETTQEELANYWEDEGIRMYLEQENDEQRNQTSTTGGEEETPGDGTPTRSSRARSTDRRSASEGRSAE